MEFNVNNIGNISGASSVNSTSGTQDAKFQNCIFGNKPYNNMQMQFNGEEQHILGIFAKVQDNILIED